MQQLTDQNVGKRKDVPGQYLDIALVAGIIRYMALQCPLTRPRKVLCCMLRYISSNDYVTTVIVLVS